MVGCRVLGHRFRFYADGATMRWECQRGCGAAGEKTYASPADAARYASVFDREDRDALARRPAMLSLIPLKLWYKLRGDRR